MPTGSAITTARYLENSYALRFVSSFYRLYKSSFYQDRLGTNTGETQQEHTVEQAKVWQSGCNDDGPAVGTAGAGKQVRNAIFVPFIYKNDHFAKTGSGQT